MATRSLAIELDEETIRALASLGSPAEVLAHLAQTAAEGVSLPGRPKREQTDQSLRVERGKSDAAIARERTVIEEAADAVVRVARRRADEVVRTARDAAEGQPRTGAVEASSRSARTTLEGERSDADALLEGERAMQRSGRASLLAVERRTTDKDLTGERVDADALIVDQREANEEMFRATLLAHEQEAEAKERERGLRTVAEFREMFIGILGHDLRNPIGAITGAAALLIQRGHLDARDAETTARIIRSSQRISRMITQLLDLTRTRLGGGLPLEAKPIDLREVCRNAIEEFEAPIELETEGDLSGTWDEDRLAEVLSNLIGNALEYSARGTPVRVQARAEGAGVAVEVANEGDPIPADALPHIFEPFRRARREQRSAAGNLGLGLYIARQIVVAHGGTLEVRSGDGSTVFIMRLPRHPPRREERRESAPAQGDAGTTT